MTMTQPRTDLLEMVLRDLANHAPWYPSEFVEATVFLATRWRVAWINCAWTAWCT